LVNKGGVTSQRLDFFVGDDQSTDSLGEIDQEGGVSDVISGDSAGISSDLSQIFFSSFTEDWETENGVSDKDGTVLNEEVIEASHVKSSVNDGLGVGHEDLERVVDSLSFPFVTSVEGDFLGVVK
jgi:hypothetical protein